MELSDTVQMKHRHIVQCDLEFLFKYLYSMICGYPAIDIAMHEATTRIEFENYLQSVTTRVFEQHRRVCRARTDVCESNSMHASGWILECFNLNISWTSERRSHMT